MGHDRYFSDQITYADNDCLDLLKQSRETTEY